MSTEILAPAGGREQLIAAVRCGATAVYLGARGFNARRNAENFDSLKAAVSYCHARGVRVYVAVNTLVTDQELPMLMDTLKEIASSGADAIIVQDMQVLHLALGCLPGVEVHASTQMTIHNAAGARMLHEMGVTRAILARELSIEEIRIIHEAVPQVQLEAFVHGALCMCVSGACYLSSMLGGRSGNRGLCAQPCRLDFRSGARGFALSLKDLSALHHLDALSAAGISSVKIEGRMKRPEYVAAAVTAVRQALSGEPYDLQTLRDAFSRGGFTDGYLTGKRNLTMFGVRSREDVAASQRAQGKLAALYRHEWPSVPVDMALALPPDEKSTLCVTDGALEVSAGGPVGEKAIASPIDAVRARRSLSKTGESPFYLRTLTVHNPTGLMLPSAALNAMRREALSALLGLREAPRPTPFIQMPKETLPSHQSPAAPPLHLRLQSVEQLFPGAERVAARISLPLGQVTPALISRLGPALVAEIPAVLFPGEEGKAAAQLRALAAQRLSGAICHNLGAIGFARDAGICIHGGYGLNILNSGALMRYHALGVEDATVSFELPAAKIAHLTGDVPRGALAYGHLPLMQLRCCPAQGKGGCEGCDGRPFLTDRLGKRFALLCNGRQTVTLLNPVPLNLSGEPLPGADFLTLFFTNETAAACRRITEDFEKGLPPTGERTRGLYRRTLQ